MFLLDATSVPAYSYGSEVVNMLITLFFVLGLAFVSVIFMRKMMRSKMRGLNRGSGIKILERRALNQKTSLYLVDILGKGVVIGESQNGGLQLICEFPPGTDLELKLAEEVQLKEKPLVESKNFFKFFKKQV